MLIVKLLIVFFLTFAVLSHGASEPNVDLVVNVEGFDATNGVLRLSLFDSDQAFSEKVNPVASTNLPYGERFVTFKVPPGVYGLRGYVDENQNGELDRSGIGFPIETIGFSEGFVGKSGPPSFDDVRFEVPETGTNTLWRGYSIKDLFGNFFVGAIALGSAQPYQGSDSTWRVFPTLIYLGPKFNFFGPRADYWFLEDVAITAEYMFEPWEKDDSPVFEGMKSRGATLMMGLKMRFSLGEKWSLRTVYKHDVTGQFDGGDFSASLRYATSWRDYRIGLGIRGTLETEGLAEHAYGVLPGEATETRPAYSPDYGFSGGPFLDTSHFFGDKLRVFLNMGIRFLGDEIRESPLVDESLEWRMISGVSYAL